jgi:phosphatidylethanolamine-binding protein (PEBP) family uncharacterized protein
MPISRRQLLAAGAATGASLLLPGTSGGRARASVLSCNGGRVFGMAQNTEMVFAFPWNLAEELMDGLEGTHRGGIRYAGPCPPPGPAHHYRYTVYALREPLALADGVELEPALAAIDRAASARGRLVGTFARG